MSELCQTQGWQGGLIHLKKAGLNRMDKTGFFQTIFEKIRFEAKWTPEKSSKSPAEIFFCNLFRIVKKPINHLCKCLKKPLLNTLKTFLTYMEHL